MRRAFILLMAMLFCLLFSAQAQNKYAVLLGINDYYQSPGVRHPGSLHGCVNDAKSMQALLLDRFGFTKANIYTLFDSAVTRRNVLTLLNSILQKTAKGDAVVFYYSGHGAWMSNAFQVDSIKRKMSQAMVMSNLYAPDLACLLTDEDIKTAFNFFVDKKVVITALFDCCYSGNLAMGFDSRYWAPMTVRPPEKALLLGGIQYLPERRKPVGCPVNAFTERRALADADGDGVPDCADWELHTTPRAAVDSQGVSLQPLTAEDYIRLTQTDPRFAPTDTSQAASKNNGRSFNLSDALVVAYKPTAQRPSDRKGSGFLSIAAATDYQTAAEITDETGLRHGAFTKALLSIYKSSPANLSVTSLLEKITATMKEQRYYQNPVYRLDESRTKGNLIGIGDAGFSNIIRARCVAVVGNRITLDKGLYAGLAKGNVLQNSGNANRVVIDSVNGEQAMASATAGARPGEVYSLVSRFSLSAPKVKIYIPEAPFTQSGFAAFFQRRIKPQTEQPFYTDYYSAGEALGTAVRLYSDEKRYVDFGQPSIATNAGDSFRAVLLPLPSYVMGPLKKMVAVDQNIQLVGSAGKADYVLYLNYAKPRDGRSASFVFYYHPPVEKGLYTIYSAQKLEAATLQLNDESVAGLRNALYELTKNTVRYQSNDWMNAERKKKP